MILTKEEKIRADFEFIRDYELAEREKYGKELGKQAGILETARNMLLEHFDTAIISKITGLSKDEINSIKL